MRRRTIALLLVAAAATLGAYLAGMPASAVHDGHFIGRYYAEQFVDNPPNELPVYDCGGGHSHPTIIQNAITNLNATGLVNFDYKGTTPCDTLGFPLIQDAISVFHDQNISTANFFIFSVYAEPSRLDDVGLETDIGMRALNQGRIRIKTADSPPCNPDPDPPCNTQNTHTVEAIVHELGHAAGLADLYNHAAPTPTPCATAHKHNTGDTVMDCTVGTAPLQHDIDNLDSLYKKKPTMVDDFQVTNIDISGGTASVAFAWTDRSFNEKVQYIGFPGAPIPLAPVRDAETAIWSGLQIGAQYCFTIQQENGYGVLGDPSNQGNPVCVWIPPDLSGVYDILAHDGTETVEFFSCISRVEHDVNTDKINSRQQCNLDVTWAEDTPPSWCEMASACNPSEPEGDLVPGPPRPPPYTGRAPVVGAGQMYLNGHADCPSQEGPCLVETICFEDIASPYGLGPNIIMRTAFNDPGDLGAANQVANDGKFSGFVDIWYNQNNANCAAGTPKGMPSFPDVAVTAYLAYEDDLVTVGEDPPRWRDTPCGTPPCNPNPGGNVFNLDGDSCYDWVELLPTPPSTCGDDPYNPTDSFSNPDTIDLSGAYDLTMRVTRGDCGKPVHEPGNSRRVLELPFVPGARYGHQRPNDADLLLYRQPEHCDQPRRLSRYRRRWLRGFAATRTTCVFRPVGVRGRSSDPNRLNRNPRP